MIKKILLAALVMISCSALSAQNITTRSASSANAVGDTITFSPMPSKVNGFQATVTKGTGTIAGKVYLEGTINGTWVKVDSLTLADLATNTKVFPVTRSVGTTYAAYRFNYAPTGTQTSTFKVAFVRRVDE